MAWETHALYAAAADAIGHKALARCLNVSLQHTYVLTADPLAIDAPVRDDLSRIESVIEALAAHPRGRPALITWRLHLSELFARVVDREMPRALTAENVVARAQTLCAEVGDVLRECRPGFCPDKLATECAELIAVLEQIVACAEASDDKPKVRAVR